MPGRKWKAEVEAVIERRIMRGQEVEESNNMVGVNSSEHMHETS